MKERIDLLRQVSFCRDLPETTLHALSTIAIPQHYPAGAVLYLEDDPATAMYVVVQGRVKIARVSVRGREQVLHVITPGQHFNTVPVFDNGPCPASAEALTKVDLFALPSQAMRHVVEAHPQLALALLHEVTSHLRHMVNLVDTLALHPVQERLAHLLLSQAEASARGEDLPPLTQAEMAARLGTVREMVGRTLKTFEILGLVRIERGTIIVLDREGLAAQIEQ